jgi:hypothetical protein
MLFFTLLYVCLLEDLVGKVFCEDLCSLAVNSWLKREKRGLFADEFL